MRVRGAQVAAGQVSAAVDDQGVAYVWGEHEVLSHPERPDQAKHIPLSVKWLPQRVQVISVPSRSSVRPVSDEGDWFRA
jgi:hypothetical protein